MPRQSATSVSAAGASPRAPPALLTSTSSRGPTTVGQARHVVGRRYVALHRAAPDLLGERLEPVGPPRGAHHVEPLGREPTGRRRADPAAGPRHHCEAPPTAGRHRPRGAHAPTPAGRTAVGSTAIHVASAARAAGRPRRTTPSAEVLAALRRRAARATTTHASPRLGQPGHLRGHRAEHHRPPGEAGGPPAGAVQGRPHRLDGRVRRRGPRAGVRGRRGHVRAAAAARRPRPARCRRRSRWGRGGRAGPRSAPRLARRVVERHRVRHLPRRLRRGVRRRLRDEVPPRAPRLAVADDQPRAGRSTAIGGRAGEGCAGAPSRRRPRAPGGTEQGGGVAGDPPAVARLGRATEARGHDEVHVRQGTQQRAGAAATRARDTMTGDDRRGDEHDGRRDAVQPALDRRAGLRPDGPRRDRHAARSCPSSPSAPSTSAPARPSRRSPSGSTLIAELFFAVPAGAAGPPVRRAPRPAVGLRRRRRRLAGGLPRRVAADPHGGRLRARLHGVGLPRGAAGLPHRRRAVRDAGPGAVDARRGAPHRHVHRPVRRGPGHPPRGTEGRLRRGRRRRPGRRRARAGAAATSPPAHEAAAAQAAPTPVAGRVLWDHRRTYLTLGLGIMVIGAARSARVVLVPLWAEHVGLSAAARRRSSSGSAAAVEVAAVLPGRLGDGPVRPDLGRGARASSCSASAPCSLPLSARRTAVRLVALVGAVGNGLGLRHRHDPRRRQRTGARALAVPRRLAVRLRRRRQRRPGPHQRASRRGPGLGRGVRGHGCR